MLLIILIGLEVGSFANVCIYRWPRNSSILKPLRSQCVWCQNTIHWYDNIPIISYLLLGGRCRFCNSLISVRYPVVELIVPVLWVFCFFLLKNANIFFVITIFFLLYVLVVTSFTDLDWKIIPNQATYSLLLIGLLGSPWNPLIKEDLLLNKIINSFWGMIVGGGSLYAVASIGKQVWGKDVMGGGDIKLLAALGSILTWKGALVSLLLGSTLGGGLALLGLSFGFLKPHQYIPFGPFLNMGAFFTLIVFFQYPQLLNYFY